MSQTHAETLASVPGLNEVCVAAQLSIALPKSRDERPMGVIACIPAQGDEDARLGRAKIARSRAERTDGIGTVVWVSPAGARPTRMHAATARLQKNTAALVRFVAKEERSSPSLELGEALGFTRHVHFFGFQKFDEFRGVLTGAYEASYVRRRQGHSVDLAAARAPIAVEPLRLIVWSCHMSSRIGGASAVRLSRGGLRTAETAQ